MVHDYPNCLQLFCLARQLAFHRPAQPADTVATPQPFPPEVPYWGQVSSVSKKLSKACILLPEDRMAENFVP